MAEKSAVSAPDLDLFGLPKLVPPEKRGRKAHAFDTEVAESIALSKAAGATDEEAAASVGLSLPTVKKYYLRSLRQGTALVRRALLRTQLTKALTGNTAAAKFVDAQIEKGELIEVAYRAPAGREPQAERTPKPGLKQQRQAQAEEVGDGMFAPGAPPSALTAH